MTTRSRSGGTGHKMLALLEQLHGAAAPLTTSTIADRFREDINRVGNFVRYAEKQGFVARVGTAPGRGRGIALWRITPAGEQRRATLARLNRVGYEPNMAPMRSKGPRIRANEPAPPRPWPLLKLSRMFAVCSFLVTGAEAA